MGERDKGGSIARFFFPLTLDPPGGDEFLRIRKVSFVVHYCPSWNAHDGLRLEREVES